MPKLHDLTGRRFGEVVVIHREPSTKGQTRWLCVCDCGKKFTAQAGNLREGRTKTCGCAVGRSAKQRFTTHGKSKTPEYKIYMAVKKRCYKPSAIYYRNYGGRGIRMCERWKKSFEAFISDMGPRPSPKHSIERNNNDGNYEPENCRWATFNEQSLNKRNTVKLPFNGEEVPLKIVAEKIGLRPETLRVRLARGWTLDQALTGKGRRKGVIQSIR